MILSPPFLPEPQPETDAQFVERAMPGGAAGDGGYPVSFDLNWHGGLHLTAPTGPGGAVLPVRAIADGTIAFVRPPSPDSTDSNHPLNYRGAWTDNGCIVIRHETEIGMNPTSGQPTTVVFFSVYMHLRSIAPGVAQGHRIFRKAEIGTAGRIYGVDHRVHFEIICDDVNVERLTGRRDTYLSVGRDGRTDVVFGAMWFMLPVDTEFRASEPLPGQPLPPIIHQNDEALFVRIELRAGAAAVQTFHLDGRPLAPEQLDADFEYNLFQIASNRFPNSPSAGYDLLRFGRVLGPDALNPPDAPHWRLVSNSTGAGWVDLNQARVRRFSDADFPHWDNWWMLVDGSSSADSRCNEPAVLELLDADNDWKVPPEEATRSLNDPARQQRLSHKICKHRTEWDSSNIDARYGWIRTDPRIGASQRQFENLKAHITALTFWEQASLGLDPVHWHFHPRLFIRHFRQCGWLGLDELAQLMPRRPTGAHSATADVGWTTALSRFQNRYGDLNRVFRKYNMLDASRQSHFLAQTYIETALWTTMREIGRARPGPNGTWPVATMEYYAAFYGRGIMQLTWAGNYAAYGMYRQFPSVPPHTVYGDNRITTTSKHYFSDPRDSTGAVVGTPHHWFPRYDPEIVADDSFAACDSGSFYWVSKNIGHHQMNINRVADAPFDPTSVGRISVLVNGGGFGFVERQRWAAYVHRFRSDSTETALTKTFVATHAGAHHNIAVDFTPQRP